MEKSTKRNTYHNSFNREVKFFDKKFRNIGTSSDRTCERRIDNIFRFTQPTTCYQDIQYTTKLDPVVFIKNCEEIPYNFYNDDMTAKERKFSDFRNWFDEPQHSIKEYASGASKKDKEMGMKERIMQQQRLEKESWINEKGHDKSAQVRGLGYSIGERTRIMEVKTTEIRGKLREKEEKNETINRISELVNWKGAEVTSKSRRSAKNKGLIREIPVNSTEDYVITKDLEESQDILFYDVPGYWKDEDIFGALQNLGYIKRLRIKRSYKYISVRVDINLNISAQEKYDKGAANVAILYRNRKFFFRWFPGSFKAEDIKSRNRYQLLKPLSNRKGFVDEVDIVVNAAKEYGASFAKLIKVHGRKYILLYYAQETKMKQSLERSILTEPPEERLVAKSQEELINKEGNFVKRTKNTNFQVCSPSRVPIENKDMISLTIDNEAFSVGGKSSTKRIHEETTNKEDVGWGGNW